MDITNTSCVVQDALREGGLPGVDVRRDTNVALECEALDVSFG